MSWRPFFDLQQLELLRSQIPDHPQGAGRGGLTCPSSLAQKAVGEYGYTVVDGKTTGNCCVLAFANSAIAQGCRAGWKRLNETKRCAEARKMGCDWASKHKHEKLWGGWSFQELVELIQHTTFEKWLSRLRLADNWGDVTFLHALACSIGADALVVENVPGPAKLLGKSLMIGDHDCTALIPVAFHNCHHFWALLPQASRATEQVCVKFEPNLLASNRDIQDREHDEDFDTLEPSELVISCREQELQLCEALSGWSPFDLPSEQIVGALQILGRQFLADTQAKSNPQFPHRTILPLRNLAGPQPDNVPVGVMARARRFAILQLAREDGGEQAGSLVSHIFKSTSAFPFICRTCLRMQNTSGLKGAQCNRNLVMQAANHAWR